MEEPAGRNGRSRTWLIIAHLVVVLAFIGMLSGCSGDPEAVDTTAPATTETPTTTGAPTTTEAPTTTGMSTTTVATTTTTARTPEETIRAMIREAVGDPNREGIGQAAVTLDAGQINVVWALNDSLTAGMIKTGSELDATDILEAVANSGVDYERVSIEGTFSMVDQLGNIDEDRVVAATYEKSLIDQIDFEGFLSENVFEIADSESVFIHPAFEGEG